MCLLLALWGSEKKRDLQMTRGGREKMTLFWQLDFFSTWCWFLSQKHPLRRHNPFQKVQEAEIYIDLYQLLFYSVHK